MGLRAWWRANEGKRAHGRKPSKERPCPLAERLWRRSLPTGLTLVLLSQVVLVAGAQAQATETATPEAQQPTQEPTAQPAVTESPAAAAAAQPEPVVEEPAPQAAVVVTPAPTASPAATALAAMPVPAASSTEVSDEASDPVPFVVPPLVFKLTEDGKSYLRFLLWSQVWVRAMELNPGTVLKGSDADVIGDVALRRTRMLFFGQLTPDVLIQVHLGVNNQTFEGDRKPQIFVHSAWGQFDVIDRYLSVGAGLHYWRGISRMTNASTTRFLALDGPILNWPTIEASDQFGHQLGIFAKGKFGALDYRVAVNRPFTRDATLRPGVTDFDVSSTDIAWAGYLQWMFADQESDLLPYAAGTYLGSKRVLNVGLGAHYQADAMARCQVDGEGMCGSGKESFDMLLLGADVFADMPVGDGAVTAYSAYYYYDFGPDFVRQIGIMTLGAAPEGPSPTVNGAGNRYPSIGTGHHVYLQGGYLLPMHLGTTRLQPYATLQFSVMDAFADPMIVPEVGVNWLISGHNVKITAHYRNRPLFVVREGEDKPVADGRASEFITQLQVAL